jgi:hypothetical protein
VAKKQTLFPLAYDEISLVDAGGGAAEDDSIAPSVLIAKRDGSRVRKLNPVGNNPTRKKSKQTPGTKPNLTTHVTSPSPSSSTSTKPLNSKKKKKVDPCNPKSSTGKKTGKSSKRAKTWAEGKHPRQTGSKGGQFGTTSSASKKKYGKGGTTKAKQLAECKRRHGSPKPKSTKAPRYVPMNARARNAKGRKRSSAGVGATVAKSWDTDARVRALLERKAAR